MKVDEAEDGVAVEEKKVRVAGLRTGFAQVADRSDRRQVHVAAVVDPVLRMAWCRIRLPVMMNGREMRRGCREERGFEIGNFTRGRL
jgi:hypothetical protein